ncbi:uncharacterized protein LOC126994815 [Eriocheir sinensis]|uniref:uncharacterized protein LOC126994815 n=1 Tax=Eriocheir sinensis TaxID=95602 RepID=UPI0021C7D31C|nr:uncharacterized protein LOC126994815 [Eriocheir sinensis]
MAFLGSQKQCLFPIVNLLFFSTLTFSLPCPPLPSGDTAEPGVCPTGTLALLPVPGSLCQQEVRGEADPSTFTPSLSFQGLVGVWPLRLQTRDAMQLLTPQTQQLRERIGEKLLQLRREEAVVLSESPRLCLVCDEQVEQHAALRKGKCTTH